MSANRVVMASPGQVRTTRETHALRRAGASLAAPHRRPSAPRRRGPRRATAVECSSARAAPRSHARVRVRHATAGGSGRGCSCGTALPFLLLHLTVALRSRRLPRRCPRQLCEGRLQWTFHLRLEDSPGLPTHPLRERAAHVGADLWLLGGARHTWLLF